MRIAHNKGLKLQKFGVLIEVNPSYRESWINNRSKNPVYDHCTIVKAFSYKNAWKRSRLDTRLRYPHNVACVRAVYTLH